MTGTALLRLKARCLGIELGEGVRCWGKVHLSRHSGSRIEIGNNVSVVSSSQRCTSSSIYAPTKFKTLSRQASIVVDDGVGLNGTSITARTKSIKIGAETMVAPNVVIMDSDFHVLWPPEGRVLHPAFETDADVLIGKNVWIGSGSMILKGSRVGDNSVIAAGSVVTGDIPANVLAGGVPARVIRSLP